MELHGSAEIQQHVSQIGTFTSKFMQYGVRDELDRQFNVAQRRAKTNTGNFLIVQKVNRHEKEIQ